MNQNDNSLEILKDAQKVEISQSTPNKDEEKTYEVDISKEDEQLIKNINPENITEKNEDNINYKEMFKEVIKNIFEVNYDLGECFEKSFEYESCKNDILYINSTAIGECKQLLYKNFKHIRNYIEEVFGNSIEIEFNKIVKESKKEMARIVQPMTTQSQTETADSTNSTASMIEDVELNQNIQSSSCVGSLCDTKEPTLAQVELSINDVLNSSMTHTAIELFQPRNPPKIKNKI